MKCEWFGKDLGEHDYVDVPGGKRCVKCKHEIKDQPTLEEKKAALHGIQNGWDFSFNPPPVPTAFWDDNGWIAYIGDNWFRVGKENAVGAIDAKLTTPYPFCRTPRICAYSHRCMAEICCAD